MVGERLRRGERSEAIQPRRERRPGALPSVGDSHATQGDGEFGGTAVKFSLTEVFELIFHKQAKIGNLPF